MNILVVDDHQLFRKAFIVLLKGSFDHEISCDEARNGCEALDIIHKKEVNLLTLDVNMPQMDGIELCSRIRKENRDLPIVVLTQYDHEPLISHFIDLGVNSFLSKNLDVAEMKAAVHSAVLGKKYMTSEVREIVNKKKNEMPNDFNKVELTWQEKQLLRYLQDGFTSKEIADRMHLTDKTVRTYKERIMEKTNTKNAAELITFGFRNGILR